MRVAISDGHFGGLDLHRQAPDMLGNMTTGFALIDRFAGWAVEHGHLVYGFGDMVDFCDKYAEAYRKCKSFFRCEPEFWIGNHDRRMVGVPPWWARDCLDMTREQQAELVTWVYIKTKGPRPEWQQPEAFDKYHLRARHGHQLDEWWNDPSRREERLQERIIKMGRYMQERIHPKSDEWILRGGKRLLHKLLPVLPKGARIDDRSWVDKVIADMPPEIDVEIDGHTHSRLWVYLRRLQKEVANLGSWVPRLNPKGKGEVLMPGIWLLEERRLIGWTMEGPEELKRGEW